jgi:arylsulfatase A-like enzyme
MVPDQAVSERREALIRGRWKLIRSDRSGPGVNGGGAGVELYDLIADPAEATNLAGSAPQFRELLLLLDQRRALEAQSPFAPLAK